MKLLLTSAGITNQSIHAALVDLLDKPIQESTALFIPTGIYPFPNGFAMASREMFGQAKSPLCQLGWKSLASLELTALPSIDPNAWLPMVEAADALLVWGGDVLYLSYWMKKSGLTDLLNARKRDLVYVGVSAGSMAASTFFAETFSAPSGASSDQHTSEEIVLTTPSGPLKKIIVSAKGAGLIDFALIPHLNHPDHPDACMTGAAQWAAKLSSPVYAIDDQTAIKIVDHQLEVISEGQWRLFNT